MQRGSKGARIAAGVLFLVVFGIHLTLVLTGDLPFTAYIPGELLYLFLLSIAMFAAAPKLATIAGGMMLAYTLPDFVSIIQSVIQYSSLSASAIILMISVVLMQLAVVFFLLAMTRLSHAAAFGCISGSVLLVSLILVYVQAYAISKAAFDADFVSLISQLSTILLVPALFLSGFAVRERPDEYETYDYAPQPRGYEAYAPQRPAAQQWQVQRPVPPQPRADYSQFSGPNP